MADIYAENHQNDPEPARQDEAGEIVRRLLVTAKMLLQNSEGCALNHYGDDSEKFGRPGWLVDCRRDIERADAFITTQRGAATEDLVERVAEGLWDAYMASPIRKPEYEGVTWPMIRDGAKERPLIVDLYETGLQEARAAIRIVHQKKEP